MVSLVIIWVSSSAERADSLLVNKHRYIVTLEFFCKLVAALSRYSLFSFFVFRSVFICLLFYVFLFLIFYLLFICEYFYLDMHLFFMIDYLFIIDKVVIILFYLFVSVSIEYCYFFIFNLFFFLKCFSCVIIDILKSYFRLSARY
jgi:hypothetical protein